MPVTCTHRRQYSSTSKRRNSLKSAAPPSANSSASSKIVIVRDEFAPAPNKRRRFHTHQTVTEEEARNLLQQQHRQAHSPSPDNWQQPLWDLLKSSYSLLMDDGGIIENCKSSETQPETDGGEAYTLLEFYTMWKEHNDWLRQLQLRLQRPAASKAERYLVQLDAESDQRAHLSAQKKVSHYASALCLANPRVADDVSAKMRSLQESWLAVESALELWPGSGGSLLADLHFDLDESQAWLNTANENRLKVPADVTLLTREQKTDFLSSVQTREDEIQSRLKAMDAVLKVLERLSDDCEPDDRVAQLLSIAEGLRSQFFELLLQLLEVKFSLDEDFQQAGRSLRSGASEAAAAAAAPSVAAVPSSWGAESGFVSELSPTGAGGPTCNRTLTAGAVSPDSCDILPFSEDEYEKISSQSSEPIFSLDDFEQQQHRRRNKAPQSADQQTLRRRRRIRDRAGDDDEATAGDPTQHQSRCYYRIMTAADSDDGSQQRRGAAFSDVTSDAVAVASSSMMTASTANTATPGRSDDHRIVEDDSSSSGGGGGTRGSSGQKRRWTRSSSPLAVVTRELYVDAGALLLGGNQPIPRAASLGAIGGGGNGALSVVMAMETAESDTGLAVELADVEFGLSDFASPDSTDGSLADESSIGHSSSPPSPSPAPAPTPTERMPPAMSVSAAATVNYRRQRGRFRRRRSSRDGLLVGQQQHSRQSEQRHRLMDARRLACKAERYFTRSAGQLCASAVGFLTQEDHSVCLTGSNETIVSASVTAVHALATAAVTITSSASEPSILVKHSSSLENLLTDSGGQEAEEEVAVNGPEDLDQLWDHYQPLPYAVGADEAAEERLDDSHLQWEADQQQFESSQDQRRPDEQLEANPAEADTVSAASASLSESESAAGLAAPLPVSDSDSALLAESHAALADLLAELRRTAANGSFDDDEAALAEEAARLNQLASVARIRRDELGTSGSAASVGTSSSSSSSSPQQLQHRQLATDWGRLAGGFAGLSEACSALAEVGAQLAGLRAEAEAVEARLRLAVAGGVGDSGRGGGQLADRIRLLRDSEATLHGWLDGLVGLHSRLESACAVAETALLGVEPLPKWMAQIRQCRADQIVMLSHWLGSMREGCGSRLFSLLRAQEQLLQAESAVGERERALAGKEHRLRQCAAELADFNPAAAAPRLRVDQLDLLVAEVKNCMDECFEEASQSSAGHWRQLVVGGGGELSDNDIGNLIDRQSEIDSRILGLHNEATRLLNSIFELKNHQQLFTDLSSSGSSWTSPTSSSELASAGKAAAAPVGVSGALIILGFCCCCLLLLLLALLQSDWQIVSISQPNGAPY